MEDIVIASFLAKLRERLDVGQDLSREKHTPSPLASNSQWCDVCCGYGMLTDFKACAYLSPCMKCKGTGRHHS